METAVASATVHRLGVPAVADDFNGTPRVPPGERLARVEERLKAIEEKLDREVHDLRYDFTRMEGHQEQILREMSSHKADISNQLTAHKNMISDQIREVAGMLRDQRTRHATLGYIMRWVERVITWAVALGAIWFGSQHGVHHD